MSTDHAPSPDDESTRRSTSRMSRAAAAMPQPSTPQEAWDQALDEAGAESEGPLDALLGYWLAQHLLRRPQTTAAAREFPANPLERAWLKLVVEAAGDAVQQLRDALALVSNGEHAQGDGGSTPSENDGRRSAALEIRRRYAEHLCRDYKLLQDLLPLAMAPDDALPGLDGAAAHACRALIGVSSRIGWRAAEMHHADALAYAAQTHRDRVESGGQSWRKTHNRDSQQALKRAFLSVSPDSLTTISKLYVFCCVRPPAATISPRDSDKQAPHNPLHCSKETFTARLRGFARQVGRRIAIRADQADLSDATREAPVRDDRTHVDPAIAAAIQEIARRYAIHFGLAREPVEHIRWLYKWFAKDMTKAGVELDFLPHVVFRQWRPRTQSAAPLGMVLDPLSAALDALHASSAPPA